MADHARILCILNRFLCIDENFRAKVLADGDRLLKLDGCINNPCANGIQVSKVHKI